jgi:hypothetical protein
MPIAVAQPSVVASATSGTTLSPVLGSTPTPTNMLIMAFGCSNDAPISSIVGAGGTTWSLAAQLVGHVSQAQVWIAPNIAGGAADADPLVTLSGSIGGSAACFMLEVSGAAASNAVDLSSSAPTIDPGPITPTKRGEIVITAMASVVLRGTVGSVGPFTNMATSPLDVAPGTESLWAGGAYWLQGAAVATTAQWSRGGTDEGSGAVVVSIFAALPLPSRKRSWTPINRAANWMRDGAGLLIPERSRERIVLPRLALAR